MVTLPDKYDDYGPCNREYLYRFVLVDASLEMTTRDEARRFNLNPEAYNKNRTTAVVKAQRVDVTLIHTYMDIY